MLQKPKDAAVLDGWMQALEKRRTLPATLPWEDQVAALVPNTGSVHQGVNLVLAGVACDVPLDVESCDEVSDPTERREQLNLNVNLNACFVVLE
jgi:hypothetical protein